MYGYQIGRFNIDVYDDECFDKGVGYHLTIISEFDDNEKEIERRTLYINGDYDHITKHFKSMSEDDVAKLFHRTNDNLKVKIKVKVEKYIVAYSTDAVIC